MSLQHDIQQNAFRNEYQKAIINILYTQNYLVGRISDVFKRFDITRQQYNVLRILRGQYPESASINLIKERMLEKMSDSSRIVERLHVKGLIVRSDSENDKRTTQVTITPEGLELLKRMRPYVEDLETYLGHLTIEEAEHLNLLLDKVRKPNLRKAQKQRNSSKVINQPEKF